MPATRSKRRAVAVASPPKLKSADGVMVSFTVSTGSARVSVMAVSGTDTSFVPFTGSVSVPLNGTKSTPDVAVPLMVGVVSLVVWLVTVGAVVGAVGAVGAASATARARPMNVPRSKT